MPTIQMIERRKEIITDTRYEITVPCVAGCVLNRDVLPVSINPDEFKFCPKCGERVTIALPTVETAEPDVSKVDKKD